MSPPSRLTERLSRAGVAAIAFACFALGAFLAWHYPLLSPLGVVAFVLWAAIAWRYPLAWLVVIPALLPVCGLATWTGWTAFEELDLLVLGAAAGGYARLASTPQSDSQLRAVAALRPAVAARVVVVLFAFSWFSSLMRGVSDAGGFVFDFFGSYNSAMNTIRVGKSFALALLLWPLLRSGLRTDERRTIDLLAGGLVLGLAAASLAALWERAAFTGVLDFSSDYRTTGLFWEMHVGGAALDGFLALTVPFVAWELSRKSGPIRLASVLALAVLTTYTCLTTFSRSVYLAVPLGLAVLAVLVTAQRRSAHPTATNTSGWRIAGLACIGVAVFYVVFRNGGYRALGAFLLTFAAALALGRARPATLVEWTATGAAWAAMAAAGIALAMLLPKGAYVGFGVALAVNAALFVSQGVDAGPRTVIMRWAAFAWLAAAAAVVALHWGGKDAFLDSAIALIALVALTIRDTSSPSPWIATDRRSAVLRLGAAGMLAAGVAVFTGGAYMGDRFSATGDDFGTRARHWHAGLALLQGNADWWLGKGLGRFPASYLFDPPDGAFPGSYEFHQQAGDRFLTLAGPSFSTGWGELFRIAQRVSPSPGAYTVLIEARAKHETQLQVEICEQHLLYNGACAVATVSLPAEPGWQRRHVTLDGHALGDGSWYAPRLAFLSLAVETSRMAVDIDEVALIGPDGRNLLANGDFGKSMSRWIPISEKYHLPWHIKSLALNVLFDQGIVGLMIFAVLLAAALWRLTYGRARYHLLAPCLAAGIIGFVVVGAFDSLLDVPRLAFLFWLLLLASLGLSAPVPSAPPRIYVRAPA